MTQVMLWQGRFVQNGICFARRGGKEGEEGRGAEEGSGEISKIPKIPPCYGYDITIG